jgi:FkbM family methyltransferase
MIVTKPVVLHGEKVVLHGDEGDGYFRLLKKGKDCADSVVTGVLPLVRPDAVCLDIGANVGLYSIAVARHFPGARMIACEPVPRTYECLKLNAAENAPNVSVLPIAVSTKDGTAQMNFSERFAAGSHMTSIGSLVNVENMGDTEVTVSVRSVDSLVAELELPRVDLIKIDVEGYELDVLEGASNTLARFQPMAQIEFNSWTFAMHRQLLPQQALEGILEIFPFVYVHERDGDGFGRVSTPIDRLALLRSNLLHGSVDNLLCGFSDLVPDAPAYNAVWERFSGVAEQRAFERSVPYRVLKRLRRMRGHA